MSCGGNDDGDDSGSGGDDSNQEPSYDGADVCYSSSVSPCTLESFQNGGGCTRE